MPRKKVTTAAVSTATPLSTGSELHVFGDIPSLIHEHGRVQGFEKVRDILLENWEGLSAKMNPYSTLKLAIETDRHAMFADVAEQRAKGAFNRELWDKYQEYLQGNVDAAPDLGVNESMLPPALNLPPAPEEETDGTQE